MKEKENSTLLNLFYADIVDPSLRDETASMEHPFFSLSKKKRTTPMIYERNGNKIIVRGAAGLGVATIWDADFLIWVASQLNEAIRNGEQVSRRLWFHPHKFLVQARRINLETKNVGGKIYQEFDACIKRLKGTMIETNIKAGNKIFEEVWSWIDYYHPDRDEKGRLKAVEVIISDWLFRRIAKDKAILAIHEDYFIYYQRD